MKPLLRGPPIEPAPSIKRTVSWVPKVTRYMSFIKNPLLSGTDTKISCIFGYFLTELTVEVLGYVLEIRTILD